MTYTKTTKAQFKRDLLAMRSARVAWSRDERATVEAVCEWLDAMHADDDYVNLDWTTARAERYGVDRIQPDGDYSMLDLRGSDTIVEVAETPHGLLYRVTWWVGRGAESPRAVYLLRP